MYQGLPRHPIFVFISGVGRLYFVKGQRKKKKKNLESTASGGRRMRHANIKYKLWKGVGAPVSWVSESPSPGRLLLPVLFCLKNCYSVISSESIEKEKLV